jgi:hypothetical protein
MKVDCPLPTNPPALEKNSFVPNDESPVFPNGKSGADTLPVEDEF